MIQPSFDPGFSTAAMSAAFAPAARVEAMCRVEHALALALADAGVVPAAIAERIVAACDEPVPDPEAVLAEGWEAGTPVVPLLARLRGRLDDEAARWLHHGATTQDIVDTATMLQVAKGLDHLGVSLAMVARGLRDHASAGRDTPTTAWTLMQPAGSTTVGLRAAGWLSPVVTHLSALREARSGLAVQLGGPTGTLAELGEHATAVVDLLAARLGLVAPDVPWHTDRTRVVGLVGLVQQLMRTVCTIATDLVLLAHNDVAHMRGGGSSSIPGKHNPFDVIRAVAAADASTAVGVAVTAARAHELERAAGAWHTEWFAVPVAFQTAGAAVEALAAAVGTLSIESDEGENLAAVAPAAQAFVDRVVAACDRELAHHP